MFSHFNTRIPLWVNIMQVLLITIMVGQVLMYFFFHGVLAESGIDVDSIPMQNLVYEMGARTLVMVVASVFVLITQNPIQYMVVLVMNIAREGFETIIDPLFPLTNAPAAPIVDFGLHLVILAIEILALVVVARRLRASA